MLMSSTSTSHGRVAQQRAQLGVVAGLADDLDVGRVGQRVADAAPDQRVVVAQNDSDHGSPQTDGSSASSHWRAVVLGVRSELGRHSLGASVERHRQDQRRALRRRCSGRPSRPPSPARSCRPRMPKLRALARSASRRPRPLSLISSDSTPPASDRSMLHPRRVGVLGDVGERLLRRAVGHQRHARRQLQRLVAGAEAAGDAGALLEAGGHPLQRRHQALLQDGRVQVVHDPLARLDGVRDHFERGAARAAAPRRRFEWRAIQARSNFSAVSEPPTSSWISRAIAARSLLDAGLQVLRELGQPLARLRELAVGALARQPRLVRVDRVLDAPAPAAPGWPSAGSRWRRCASPRRRRPRRSRPRSG